VDLRKIIREWIILVIELGEKANDLYLELYFYHFNLVTFLFALKLSAYFSMTVWSNASLFFLFNLINISKSAHSFH